MEVVQFRTSEKASDLPRRDEQPPDTSQPFLFRRWTQEEKNEVDRRRRVLEQLLDNLDKSKDRNRSLYTSPCLLFRIKLSAKKALHGLTGRAAVSNPSGAGVILASSAAWWSRADWSRWPKDLTDRTGRTVWASSRAHSSPVTTSASSVGPYRRWGRRGGRWPDLAAARGPRAHADVPGDDARGAASTYSVRAVLAVRNRVHALLRALVLRPLQVDGGEAVLEGSPGFCRYDHLVGESDEETLCDVRGGRAGEEEAEARGGGGEREADRGGKEDGEADARARRGREEETTRAV